MKRLTKDGGLKIPVKLYRVGELADSAGFSRQTIHNYTTMGLIREAQWTRGGHRLYDESVFETLSMIMQLKQTKTLSEIKAILRKNAAGAISGGRSAGRIARSKPRRSSRSSKNR